MSLCDDETIFVVISTCVMDLLCDVDSLPVGQASVHRRSCRRSQRRVERINVKAHVDRSLFSVIEGKKFSLNLSLTSTQTWATIQFYKIHKAKLGFCKN